MSDLIGGRVSDLLSAGGDAAAAPRPIPPVHLWHPDHCGEIDIRIRRDGVWIHEGSPIGREPLVRLFASILRKVPDGFHLVTPAEKLKIEVEDAPFLAVRLDKIGGALRFLTNVGDVVEADADHPLRVVTDPSGEPAPYIRVRASLDARLRRPVFYELVELAETREKEDGAHLVVASNGVEFDLGRLDALTE